MGMTTWGRFVGRPTNYEELRQLAIQEVNDKLLELEERLDNLRKFTHYAENVTDRESLQDALDTTCVSDYDDAKDFKALWDIADNWPDVSWGPGTGYW